MPLNLKKPRKLWILENFNIFFLKNGETFSSSVFCIKFVFANKKLWHFYFLNFSIFFGQKFGSKFWSHFSEIWLPRGVIFFRHLDLSFGYYHAKFQVKFGLSFCGINDLVQISTDIWPKNGQLTLRKKNLRATHHVQFYFIK